MATPRPAAWNQVKWDLGDDLGLGPELARRVDPSNLADLASLGDSAARRCASSARRQVRSSRARLPLGDVDLGVLLNHTVSVLHCGGVVDWRRLTPPGREAFFEAWTARMRELKIWGSGPEPRTRRTRS